MELSDQDKAAVVLAKAAKGNPALRERMQRVDETRASREPVSKMHPISKMSEESAVLAEYENELLDVMSKEKCSAELALGKLAKDPAYHDLRRRYKEEMRARGA